MKDMNAAVLLKVDTKKGMAEITFAESPDSKVVVSLKELQGQYNGYAIFLSNHALHLMAASTNAACVILMTGSGGH